MKVYPSWRQMMTLGLVIICHNVLFSQKTVRYDFWLDNGTDTKVSKTVTGNSNTFSIADSLNISGIKVGLHTINWRAKADKNWSAVSSTLFYKTPVEANIGAASYEYWFDGATSTVMKKASGESTLIIDSASIASLQVGLHQFHLRFRTPGGRSSVVSSLFYKTSSNPNGTMAFYEYWFDSNPSKRITKKITLNGGQQALLFDSVDVKDLSNGMHTFNIRFGGPSGWSSVNTTLFTRFNLTNNISGIEYWFDQNTQNRIFKKLENPEIGNIADSIRVATLERGNHTISYRFKSSMGWSAVEIDTFFKEAPKSGNTDFAKDLAAVDIISPVSGCSATEKQNVRIKISNLGTVTQSNFEVGYSVNNGIEVIEKINHSISPGGSIEYTFVTPASIVPSVQTTQIKIFTRLSADENIANDGLVLSVKVLPPHSGAWSGTTTLCSGQTLNLIASGGKNYKWSNGAITAALRTVATVSTNYYVTITGDYPSCVDVDTIPVTVIPIPQTPVIQASNPELVFCEGSSIVLTSNISSNLQWTTGARTTSIAVDQSGQYGVRQLGANECHSDYTNVTVRKLSVPTIRTQGNGTLCTGNSETIIANNGSSYLWSNGATTSSITVKPTATTTYTVTVTNTAKCSYELSRVVYVAPNLTPSVAQNLLPLNGANGVELPVQLSWSPGANATLYDVFIWRDGQPEPTNPQYTDLASINLNPTNLSPGLTYRWKIRSRNCLTGPISSTQTFTTLGLSDLRTQTVQGPTQPVFSGNNLSIRWEVRNFSTVNTPALSRWYDAIYLSKDASLSNDDYFLGTRSNPSGLAANQTYTGIVDYTLPDGIEGEFFVLVIADGFNSLSESNESNNLAASTTKIKISLTPPPDLKVTTIVPPGVAGVVFSGTKGTVEWTVKNQGLGETRSKGWEDRIYYTTDPRPSTRNWHFLGAYYHQGDLAVNASYKQSASISIPEYFSDTIYIVVLTDASNREYEHFFEENNAGYSTPINVILTPQPDFVARNLTAPNVVSNNQTVQVQWQGQNVGAKHEGFTYDAVYLSSSNSALSNAIYLGSFERQGILNTDITYNAMANVRIPDYINGAYFLAVRAEAGSRVFEANENNNLVFRAITIQSPNLQISDVKAPLTATAGQSIGIEWYVANAGPGELLSANLKDEVSLSLSPDGANPILLGSLNAALSLGVNAGTNRQRNVSLPSTLSAGTYYVVVKTNSNGAVHEAGRNSDNTAVSKQTIIIAAASFPDLQAVNITVPSQINGGVSFTVRYRVRNGGASTALGRWEDYIYLSKNPVFSAGNSTLLQTKTHSQIVPIGGEYLDSVQVQLSSGLGQGIYYLHLLTDALNQVAENTAENNNQSSSAGITLQINVTTSANLSLRDVIAPISVVPGEASTLRWSVLNSGTAATPVQAWEDRLYLSTDSLFSANTDLIVERWSHNSGLARGTAYNRTERFTLPSNVSGTFFLILVTDPDLLNKETNVTDNFAVIKIGAGTSGGGNPVVSYPPAADLEIIALSTDNTVLAGQPITIRYTIRNNGPGPAKPNWGELFVLSQDLRLGADYPLGQSSRSLELKANSTYTDSIRVFVPAGAGGNYLVLGQTDYASNVAESNENNNLANAYLFVKRPLPADLVVVDITSTPRVQIGRNLNASWQLQNQGVNPISGYMRELVYLSSDTIWDAQDQLLGMLDGNIALPGNGTVTRRLSSRVENVSHAAYHLIVRTDVFNNLPEENENNNSAYSRAKVEVEIPELPIGKLVSDTLKASLPLYYRIESSPRLKDETLLITLNSSNDQAVNELYLRRGQVPNRTVFDFAFDQPFTADQQILVPTLKDSTYYILAFPVQPSRANQLVTLKAEIVEFGLSSIASNKGGNTGNVTVQIKGTKFDPDMKVQLEDRLLGKIPAIAVRYVSSVLAYVTFNLNGAKLGKYDLVASNIFADTARLTDAFEVLAGTIGAAGLQATCTIGEGGSGSPLVLNAKDPITFEAIHPASARPNQVIPITLRFENTGNVDLPVPRRFLSSLNGAPLGLASDALNPDTQELNLNFNEDKGPSDALRPGAVVIRTVYTQANRNLTVLQFNLN